MKITRPFRSSRLVQEVVKKNGERYPSRSLYSLVDGLRRYVDEKNGSLAVIP